MKELVVDFNRITKSFLRPVPSTAGESSKTNIFRRTETEKIYAVNNISFQILGTWKYWVYLHKQKELN